MTIGKELNAIGRRCFRAIKALNQTDAQVSAAVCRCQGDTMKALVLEVQRRANGRSIDVALQEVSNDLRLGVVVTVSKPAAPLTGPPAFREKRPMRRRPIVQPIPTAEDQPESITPGEEPPAEPAPEPPTDTEPPSAFDQ